MGQPLPLVLQLLAQSLLLSERVLCALQLVLGGLELLLKLLLDLLGPILDSLYLLVAV